MKILIAPDKFKGSLSAREAANSIAEGFTEIFPDAEYHILPMADGGEGMLDAFKQSAKFTSYCSSVQDALGRTVSAEWIMLGGPYEKTAVIEASQANGLWRISREERNPLLSSTYGVGQLVAAAVAEGAAKITIGIGGSATNDAGAGLASALGIRFLDGDQTPINPLPQNFGFIRFVEHGRRIALPEITVACDVDNPLLGISGASRVYGPQKGLNDEQIEIAEDLMVRFSGIIDKHYGRSFKNVPGAGAAGGLGYGLMSFCEAGLVRGFDCVAGTLQTETWVREADLVITGEGSLDAQSLAGKTPIGISGLARKYGVPVYAVAGKVADRLLLSPHFDAMDEILADAINFEDAISRANIHLANAAKRLAMVFRKTQ